MSGGGGDRTQVVTQSQSIDPYIRGLYTEAYQTAQQLGARPYQPYPVGSRFAGPTPDTQDYYNQARILAGYAPDYIYPAAGVFHDVATGGIERATPFLVDPAQLSRSAIRDLSGGTFPSANLSAYMNPYTGEVIERTMSDLDRARQLALNDIGDAAVRARAFGGARHGVAEAETNRAFAEQMARTAAELRARGFETAAALIEQDLARGLQAGVANQAADLAAAEANARMQQEAALANAELQNRVEKENLARELLRRQIALQGAGSLLGLGLTGLDQLRQVGAEQQALEQAKRDFDYQQFVEARDYPERQLMLRTSVLHGMPVSVNSTGTTTLPSGSTAGRILGGSILGGTLLAPALKEFLPGGVATPAGLLLGATLGAL